MVLCLFVLSLLSSTLIAADTPPLVMTPAGKLDLNQLPGIVVDNDQAETKGEWTKSTHISPYVGSNYFQDKNSDKGEKFATFSPDIPKAGRYALHVSYTIGATRAANVPVELVRGDNKLTLYLDERTYPNAN